MPNIFENTSEIARDASLILSDQITAPDVVNRNHETKFANKIGDTIGIKQVPDMGDADSFTGQTVTSDIEEPVYNLKLERHFYKRVTLTSDQMTLNVDDFALQVTTPNVRALAQSVNKYFLRKIASGFAPNGFGGGVATNHPVDQADIARSIKSIQDNRGTFEDGMMSAMVSTTAWSNFIQDLKFINSDFGAERPSALRTGALGDLMGTSWYASNAVTTIDQGAIGGILLTDGASSGKLLSIKGLTGTVGQEFVNAGFQFKIAGSTKIYTVQYDSIILAGGKAQLILDDALDQAIAGDEAITAETPFVMDTLFNNDAVTGAVVGLSPFSEGSSVGTSDNNISVRVSFFRDANTLQQDVVFDLLAGCQVIHPASGMPLVGD